MMSALGGWFYAPSMAGVVAMAGSEIPSTPFSSLPLKVLENPGRQEAVTVKSYQFLLEETPNERKVLLTVDSEIGSIPYELSTRFHMH